MPLFRKITRDEAHETLTPELLTPYFEALRELEAGDYLEITLDDVDDKPKRVATRLGIASRRLGIHLRRVGTKDNIIYYKVYNKNTSPVAPVPDPQEIATDGAELEGAQGVPAAVDVDMDGR